MTHPDHEARMKMLEKDNLLEAFVTDDIVFINELENVGNNEQVPTLSYFINNVVQWHHDRNLIDGSTDKDQTLKLLQELGELSDSVCKGKDIKDDIGDMLVVMLNITTRNGVTLSECLARAWDDIKDRKGKMVDGIFVKEADL